MVFPAASESPGEGVVVKEGGGEGGGDDMEGVGGGGGGDVGAEVTEGDVEVTVVVEVGKREDVVVVEGWCGGVDDGGFKDLYIHFLFWWGKSILAIYFGF